MKKHLLTSSCDRSAIMKSKHNAFTLIELLAIIVILAIIAVITVPIILNIIENSRKGAATDSAYGYEDAVNKYQLSKLLENQNYNGLDGTYDINANGYLEQNGVVKHQIEVSGQKPTSGSVRIENKIITLACLQFGNYAVSITNGTVVQVEKGSCGDFTIAENTSSEVQPNFSFAIYENKGDTNFKPISNLETDLSIGDYVTIDNEGFYVIGVPQSTTTGIPTYNQVLLMSEYNLSQITVTPGLRGWRQDSSLDYSTIFFTDSSYWEDCLAIDEPSGCTTVYSKLYPTEEYAFIYDNNSNLYDPMNNYKTYLEGIVGTAQISEIRPMSYGEANEIVSLYEWANGDNQQYWLGSDGATFLDGDSDNERTIWYVGAFELIERLPYSYNMDYNSNDTGFDKMGVRPVIEVSLSTFMDWILNHHS